MVASADRRALYVASGDHDAVFRRDLGSKAISEIKVGREPARIIAHGDRAYVSLRAERKVAVLRDDGATLIPEAMIDVGAEPFGLAISSDGKKLWVASSLSDRIDEVDTTSLTITHSFHVPGEPRWIAIHPSGEALFVAGARTELIHRIDLDSGELSAVSLAVESNIRVRGDIAVTPNGEFLLVPAIAIAAGNGSGGWGGPAPLGPTLFDPTVIVAETSGDGELDQEEIDVVDLLEPALEQQPALNGYPSSVTVSADSTFAAVSIEGSGEVVIMPLGHLRDRDRTANQRFTARISAGAGARSVVLLEDRRMYTWAFIDRVLAEHDLHDAPQALQTFDAPPIEVTAQIAPIELAEFVPAVLDERRERGRRLFYSSNDGYVQRKGSRLSCASCHFDGREDGLTWTTNLGSRQTPSLAGPISKTAPLRWEGDAESIAADAMETSGSIMGGTGLTQEDADAIQAFIDGTRDADVPLKNATTPAVMRGKTIFERADVGCATCHYGERFANNDIVNVFGHSGVKTRSLVGVAASAPYLRDGSMATLREVLERASEGGMGRTSHLSASELDDLEAYLSSL